MRYAIPLMIICIMTSTVASSNDSKIDSLKKVLSEEKVVETRMHVLWQLCNEYSYFDNYAALPFGKQAYKMAVNLGDTAMMASAGRLLGYVYRQLEQMDSSNMISLKVLPFSGRYLSTDDQIKFLRGIALNYTWTGEYALALQYNFDALDLGLQKGTPDAIVPTLNNIGLIYYKIENAAKALSYFKSAVKVREQNLGSRQDNYIAYLNESLCYTQLGQFDSSQQVLEKAVQSKPSLRTDNDLDYLHCLANLHLGKKQYDQAMDEYKLGWKKARETGNARHQLDCTIRILETAIKLNREDESLQYFKEVEALLKKTPYGSHVMAVYQKLADLYLQKKNLAKFAHYQSKYIESKDSLYNRKYVNEMVDVERKYLDKQRNKQIADKDYQLRTKQAVIERQYFTNLLAGVIALLIIALLGVVYRGYRRGKKINFLLEEKVKHRTRELEATNIFLAKSIEEGELKRKKREDIVRHTGLNICKLVEIASNDVDHKACLSEINILGKKLVEILA